jgi:hypothetical protein
MVGVLGAAGKTLLNNEQFKNSFPGASITNF